MKQTAVILSNTGTPDSPSVADVRRYLRQFLGDGRVITMPSVLRKALVNGLIAPLRGPRSAKLYQKLWTPEGSPLRVYSEKLAGKIQNQLGDNYHVMVGMRYGNPSLKDALLRVKEGDFHQLVLVPLYPQYASSTTGTILEAAYAQLSRWNNIPALQTLPWFYDHPDFLDCYAANIKRMEPHRYEHILFSYHGLPLRHVYATHQNIPCHQLNCTGEVNPQNGWCYNAAAWATTRLLARKLELEPGSYSVCFQSRFARSWLSPFADEVIREKATQGTRSLLMVSPSFVTDCLETIVELGIEYKEIFLKHGGTHFDWVPSLNDQDDWARALAKMISSSSKS